MPRDRAIRSRDTCCSVGNCLAILYRSKAVSSLAVGTASRYSLGPSRVPSGSEVCSSPRRLSVVSSARRTATRRYSSASGTSKARAIRQRERDEGSFSPRSISPRNTGDSPARSANSRRESCFHCRYRRILSAQAASKPCSNWRRSRSRCGLAYNSPGVLQTDAVSISYF